VSEVACHNEIFQVGAIHALFDTRPELDVSIEARDSDPLKYLAALDELTETRLPECRVFGFKLFTWQSDSVLRRIVGDPNYRLLLLKRENKLAQFSSLLIAEATGAWTQERGEPGPAQTVHFDAEEFEEFEEFERGEWSKVERLIERDSGVLHLRYEELLSRDVLKEIFRFVDVAEEVDRLEEIIAEVPLVKQNSRMVASRFDNPSDVVQAMTRSGRREWLTE
jgi:hypothetical protein